jgi:molybdenum cofactor cytidylyltransferase
VKPRYGTDREILETAIEWLAWGADIIAPVYRGQRGHPVGFSARHGKALRRLRGDAGARHLIEANQQALARIETPVRGVILDVDVPASMGCPG